MLFGAVMNQNSLQAQTAEVSQVKAAYLYNFAKFVEWPPDAFRGSEDPAVICVIGDDRTSAALERAIVGKKANGRRIEAMNPRSTNEFRTCNVLFIGFTDKGRIVPILHSIAGSSVLAVGQADMFLSLGGMINLLQKDGTVTLEIDPKATDSAGLKVSSRLLVVARVVTNERAVEGP
jgi:YfiR/HmsC-like